MITEDIERLISLLAKLPGLGPRSATRATLALIKHRETLMYPLSLAVSGVLKSIKTCSICGNFDTIDPCKLCQDSRRDKTILCVVEDVADLWALERAAVFSGVYHVLGGTLSALDGIGPEELNISGLVKRVENGEAREVILATNATVEGQTTAHYIADKLRSTKASISGLAFGVPIGGELNYLDDGTLTAALKSRRLI